MIRWLLRAFLGLFGTRVLKFEVTTDVWPKDALHGAGDRYFRVYASTLVLGRFMDVEVRL